MQEESDKDITFFASKRRSACIIVAMTKVTRNFSFDADILKAAEEYAKNVTKETLSGLLQRALRELLTKEGQWPPASKGKGKAK